MEIKLNDNEKKAIKGLGKIVKGALVAGVAALALNHGYQGKSLETTETYQGYFTAEETRNLVFDKDPSHYRKNPATLVIPGNPDTLEIGKKYSVNYIEPNWSYLFPKRLKSIEDIN